jgi:hypothetical protein
VGDKLGEGDIQVGSIGDAWKPADGAFYLLHFYSESIYFYLMIDSPVELQVTLIIPTAQVAGPVHPGTLASSLQLKRQFECLGPLIDSFQFRRQIGKCIGQCDIGTDTISEHSSEQLREIPSRE